MEVVAAGTALEALVLGTKDVTPNPEVGLVVLVAEENVGKMVCVVEAEDC